MTTTTITIPAREIAPGDQVTMTVTVSAVIPDVAANVPMSTSVYFEAERLQGAFSVEPDMLAKVERPDPDVDLVEAMADALARREEWDGLADPAMHQVTVESFRADARAALAAYREVVTS